MWVGMLLALVACGPDAAAPAPAPKPAPTPDPAPKVPAPAPVPEPKEKAPMAEPDHIKVQHILVGFAGAPRLKCTRSKEEAKKLAETIFAEAKTGASMESLMDKYGTDDSKPGIYGLANRGLEPKAGSYKRDGMVPAFGNVGFKLAVGEVGMAEHDATASPYGWHIIKRVE
jgi:hypothetical protein